MPLDVVAVEDLQRFIRGIAGVAATAFGKGRGQGVGQVFDSDFFNPTCPTYNSTCRLLKKKTFIRCQMIQI